MWACEVNNSCFVVIYTDLQLSFTPLLQADASLCRNMVFFQLHYQMLHLLGLLYPQKREQNWRSHQQGSTSLGTQNAVAYAVCRQIAQGSRQIGIRLWTSRSQLAAGSKLNTTSRGECMRGQMLKGCFILNMYTDSLRFISPSNAYILYNISLHEHCEIITMKSYSAQQNILHRVWCCKQTWTVAQM